MILTGKCKKDFLNWLKKRVNLIKLKGIYRVEFWLEFQDKSFESSLIIEWFDSVGIYIEVGGLHLIERGTEYHYNLQEINTINGINGSVFNTRQEATTEAIKKANEIYNNL